MQLGLGCNGNLVPRWLVYLTEKGGFLPLPSERGAVIRCIYSVTASMDPLSLLLALDRNSASRALPVRRGQIALPAPAYVIL